MDFWAEEWGTNAKTVKKMGKTANAPRFFVVAQHVKIMDNQLVDEFRHDLIAGYGRLGRNPWV